jgi:hypothetical protein
MCDATRMGPTEAAPNSRTDLWWQTTEHDYERAIGALAGTGIPVDVTFDTSQPDVPG